MRLLLDTHTLLWFLREPDKLPQNTLQQIESSGCDALVSIVSLWEIAIKVSLNKLYLPGEYDELFPDSVTQSGLTLLAIEPSHLAEVRRLPWHHRDPFDRLLIAQGQVEELTMVSSDAIFSSYGIPILWQ